MKLLYTPTLLFFTFLLSAQYNYGLEVEQQDAKIEGKLNINDGQKSIYIGENAGINVVQSNFDNVFIGFESGMNALGSGNINNTYVGSKAGRESYWDNSFNNAYIGANSGSNCQFCQNNTAIGSGAFSATTSGTWNTYIGYTAGYKNGRNSNVMIGGASGRNNNGAENVFIGLGSGMDNTSGFANIFIGFEAGRYINLSNSLAIENSNSIVPLIYGEFDNDRAGINWDSSIPLPATLSVNGTLHISETAKLEPQTTAPSTCITAAEHGLMYYDNSSTTHKLKVCTNAGWEDLN